MFDYAWLLFALPAAGALINLLFGHLIGKRANGFLASAMVAASFLVAVPLFFGLFSLPVEDRIITVHLWNWITIGTFEAPAALLISPLSITMTLVVTGVGTLIHFYAIAYMAHDERVQRFFIYMNFFIFAMLILVLSDNLVGMFVGWEGVGLASYLLIGFWFDRRDDTYGYYADAGKKAFLVNRVGDAGMLLAIFAIWTTLGTVNFQEINAAVEHGALTVGMANFICLLLLLAATGKSAQLPLFVWLPDAMAGPTPVSALIHAATMVTAGVYLLIRTYGIWVVGQEAATIGAWIGGLTAILAASIAIVQVDLKKILAYSTISQLGYMIMGAAAGAFGAAMFHLVTHAFFKALLFLAAGSVMHGMHDVLDIRRMGGLRHKMPSTFRTYVIGSAALAGLPLMAGFFSKDAILVDVLAEQPLLYAVAMVGALMTAFYSFRAVFLVFFGKPRDQELYDHAHESPALMTVPLWILAFLSIFGGLINLPFVQTLYYWLEPAIGEAHHADLTLELLAITLSIIISICGVLMAYARYHTHENWVRRLGASFGWLQPTLEQAWYVDSFYNRAIVKPLWALSAWLARAVEGVIDGAVNGVGSVSLALGGGARRLQSGQIPAYALSILVGVVVLVVYFVFGT